MEKPSLTEVKAILKSLVLSYPDKMTVEKLNRDYRDIEGEFIPYRRLGYGNVEQFLRSIPDAIQLLGSGPTAMVCFVANKKSDHIHDMIMEQKRPKGKHVRLRTQNKSMIKNKAANGHCSNRFNTNFQQRRVLGQQLSPFETNNRNCITKTVKVRDPPRFCKENYNLNHISQSSAVNTLPKPEGSSVNNRVDLLEGQIHMYEEHVKQLGSLLKNTCYVTPTSPLSEVKSAKFENNPKNIKQNELLQPTPKNQNEHEKSLTETTNLLSEIKPPTTRNQISNKTRIILSDDVERLITMPRNSKLRNPIQESCEFQSNVQKVPAENRIENSINSHKDMDAVKLSKKIFGISDEKVNDIDEAVPQFAASKNVFRLDFPEHTVPYGKKIPPYKLPDDIKVDSRIKIFISEIHNPFKFWFHIHKDDHELDFLMYQIECFYTKLDEKDLRIPMVCLTPGQVCAARYNDMWHRAEIVGTPINNKIKVSFMDYGTVTNIDIEHIKFLASSFAHLPAQALRGCLSHIKPRSLHWSHEATKYFLTLVSELMLYAQITEINKEKQILYMILCNTNGDEVIQINKSLVQERYAYYDKEWQSCNVKENNGKRLHHPREDFPT